METKEKRGTGKKKPVTSPRKAPPKNAQKKQPAKNLAETKRRTRRTTQRQPSPDVVYVQPTPFNKGRFILCIAISVAVVLAVVFGMAIFFKVDADKILVAGNNKYSVAQIVDACGIKDGENLFSVSEARISTCIIDELPYVKHVRVGIKLPDTVKIEIEELEVVYSVEDSGGGWWLIRSDGRVIEQTNSAEAQQHTRLLGIKITEAAIGEPAKAWQSETVEQEGETVPITIRESERLQTACTILEYMEDNGIIGELASVDVSNLGDIQLWYGEKYQILLGDTLELSYKIRTLRSTLDQMGDYQSGVLDISFTMWPDQVGYTPFN